MADIINSVDRSLDMYIYDLYIYIDISLYLSVYLSLSILVGRHLCQCGASRQQKPTSCRYDTYKAFKFIAWCKAAPHNLRFSPFFCSGRSRTESSQTWEPWRNTRSPGDWSHTIQALFTGCKDLFYIHIHVQVYICIFLHKHMYKSIYMVYTNAIHM